MESRLGVDFSGMNPSPEEVQSKLEATRPLYNKACAALDGNDEEYEVKKKAAILKISRLVRGYDGKGDSSAAFILGQIRNIVDELQAPLTIKLEWENLKHRFGEIEKRRANQI